MSKTRVVQTVTQSNINFGQISSPLDLMKAQEFAHAHAERITSDFLTQPSQIDVAGFAASPVGMNANFTAGRIYIDGYQYERESGQVQCSAAHATLARIDLIIATVAADTAVNQTFTPFQRLRTANELTDGVPPYPPQQFQVPLEKHNVVTISVKTGTPSATPVQPTLASGEIALWAMLVPAAATSLLSGNFTDLRRHAANLRLLKSEISQIQELVDEVQDDVETALDYEHKQVNFASSFGRTDDILGILNEIAEKLAVLKHRYPTIVSGDGRCPAVAGLENGITPIVDIPVGTIVQFGDRFVVIDPANFQDSSVNARYTVAAANDYSDPLLDDLDLPDNAPNSNVNVVRFNSHSTTKALFINRAGQIFFRSAAQPSTSDECLLMKITPNGASAATLKRYINLRNGLSRQSGVATSNQSSRLFQYEVANPPGVGYLKFYGIKPDNTIYHLQPPGNIVFDMATEIAGIQTGDTWVVEWMILSTF